MQEKRRKKPFRPHVLLARIDRFNVSLSNNKQRTRRMRQGPNLTKDLIKRMWLMVRQNIQERRAGEQITTIDSNRIFFFFLLRFDGRACIID